MPPKQGASSSHQEDEKKEKEEKKEKKVLPRQLLAIRNLDKKDHETWDTAGDLLNFPHPFLGVLLGPPNCGKTTTVKNILMLPRSSVFTSFTVTGNTLRNTMTSRGSFSRTSRSPMSGLESRKR